MSDQVSSFGEIATPFDEGVRRIVWCTVSTVDRRGRPRGRILHPYWEGSTGWILTNRNSHKAKHLAASPWVSCSYWDPRHERVHAECRAEWVDEVAAKRRIWELFRNAPEPYGYDPIGFWPKGPDDPGTGLLRLEPWRIELWTVPEGGPTPGNPFRVTVWRADT
jgi:general stress protein 26